MVELRLVVWILSIVKARPHAECTGAALFSFYSLAVIALQSPLGSWHSHCRADQALYHLCARN